MKNDKLGKASIKQQLKNRALARNTQRATEKPSVVSGATEKLGNMTIGSRRVAGKPVPQPMKAGGWHAQPDTFLVKSQDILPGRSYTRKVAG